MIYQTGRPVMPTEREPTSVPVNLLEAFDNREPTNEQIEHDLRVLAVTRRALEACGIAVRWDTTLQAPGAGEDQDDAPNTDSISPDEVAPMMRDVRLEEIGIMVHAVTDVSNEVIFGEKHMSADDVILKLTERLRERMAEVRAIMHRPPESN
ncbi:hypothetical protein [Streptomyces sp. BBFR109]|uniref:hypothetical protein n=1 Tax=Streptomyces sp. BBFR109 TaxID=3448172 RepID=UPI003F758562